MRTLIATLGMAALLAVGTLPAAITPPDATPSVNALLSSARLWEVRARDDLARLALQKLLLAYPDQPDALLQLGLLELRSAHVDVAAGLLARAEAAHPGAPRTLQLAAAYRVATHDRLRLATIKRLRELGKTAEALRQLRELYPDGPPPAQFGLDYYRIVAASPTGWQEAREGYARLMRENPEDPQYALALAGHLLDRPASRAEGLRMLAALKRNPDADRQHAEELLQQAGARRPRDSQAMVNLAEGGNATTSPSPATRSRREAERLVAQARGADTATAESLYRRALALDDRNDTALRGLAGRLADDGRRDEALRALEDWQTRQPRLAARVNQTRASLLRDAAAEDVAGDRLGAALRRLELAQTLAPDDPWIRYNLAQLYRRLDLPRQARTLMAEGAAAAPPGEYDIYYAQALLLASLDDDAAAAAALDRIPRAQRTEGMRDLEQRLQAMAWRRENAAVLAEADAAENQGHYDVAVQRYRQLLAQRPDDAELRLSYARLLRHAGDRATAAQVLNKVLADLPGTDTDTRLAIAKERFYLGDITGSRQLVDQILQQSPDNPDALLQAGRLESAQRRYAAASDYFHRAQAASRRRDPETTLGSEEIASLEARRQGGFVTAGPSYRNKAGDAGISQFEDFEWPIEWRQPLNYDGQLFVHVDPVHASAGTLPAVYDSAALYGKVQAYGPASLAQFANGASQNANGADIGIGYQTDDWRFDVGTTPIGFPVQDVVGGIRHDGKLGALDYSADLSRRPVTSSLLSYAGARDPVTGEVWGGVRSNGLGLRLAQYERDWDASADLGFHRLTGRNVPGNNYLSARLAGSRNVIRRENFEASVGLTATHWNYGRDLSHYTFGQGGYYSPQRYDALGLPLEIEGRVGRWSYHLKGAVSYSWSRSDDSAFYPSNAALQTMAQGSPLPAGYSAPVYGGGPGGGIGYAAQGALEYQINQDYFIGGAFDIDRSAYYAPNFFTLYLRRVFYPWTKPVPVPPKPPRPYSQY